MGTESKLILFRENLPIANEIEALASETGTSIKFQTGFDFDKSPNDFVEIECEGQKVIFAYSIYPLNELEDEYPKRLKKYGDTVLSFTTRGAIAGEIVYLIQKTIAAKANAVAFNDGEMILTKNFVEEIVTGDLPPELAATLKGSPFDRAAAIEAYAAMHIPKVDPIRTKPNPLKIWFNDNKLEIITIVVLVFGLIIYTLIT